MGFWLLAISFWLFTDACIAFDVFVYIRPVVFPHVARTVGVLEELFLRGPVILYRDVAGTLVGV